MKSKIVNKLNMYHAVSLVCQTHTSAWDTTPAFVQGYDAFVAKVTALEQQAYQHTQSLVGVRENKDVFRETTIEKAEVIANALRSLAAFSGNSMLKSAMRFQHTQLEKSNATRLIQYLDSIIEAAGSHIIELPDYGVSQTKLDELIVLRDQLTHQLSATRNALVVRKSLTTNLEQLAKEIDQLLKNALDKLVLVLKADSPQFFLQYTAARVIVDHRGKTHKPKNPLPPATPRE